MSSLIMILIVVLVIIFIPVFWGIGVRNSIKVSDIKVSEALSGIDVALTKRYDVLTKMLDVAKGYMNYEKETLANIIRLRSGMSMNERNEANRNYPELKSSNNFIELQRSIADVEEHLQAARRLYNSNVTAYNKKIITFPNSIIAGMIGATQKAFFEADAEKRNDVKMTF